MKKIYLAVLLMFSANMIFAQMVKNPVTLTSSVKKVADKTYEVTIAANIQPGWHMYSMTTPEGGPIPTAVDFAKNPLVTPQGNVKEVGKMEQKFEPLFGVDVKQFSNNVKFVQTFKTRANVKTSMDVAVKYMVCDDHQCLPPSTKKLTVALK